MKYQILVAIIATALVSTASIASHELDKSGQEMNEPDGHISWHEFRHELASFAGVTAFISENGLVTLQGDVDSGVIKIQVESIARNIRGASEIHNYITSK